MTSLPLWVKRCCAKSENLPTQKKLFYIDLNNGAVFYSVLKICQNWWILLNFKRPGSEISIYAEHTTCFTVSSQRPSSECYSSRAQISVLFFSRPRSEGWPYHGRTFSIYLYPLSFWLTLPRAVLSTSWCCPSRPCVVFLACVHLALFLALSLPPRN